MIKNIKKNKFVTSTIVLLIGGFISKFLGFIIKIIITRQIGTHGIGLYSMLSPTFSLFIVLAIFSYPIAISKLVAIKGRSSKKIIFSVIPVSIIINLIIILLIFIFAPILSKNLLKEPSLYYPIICIGFTLPFIGLSNIIKGYFWGKQRMMPYMLSNIAEQIVRLIILSLTIPIFIKYSVIKAICVVILVNIISESVSTLVMIKSLPKGIIIKKEDLIPQKKEIKDVMSISIPSTSSKIIGSFAYFLEPIILTNTLLYAGYSSNYIINEYGILNGYSLSLLLLPQFFTQSISTALIPELSKSYSEGNKKKCIRRIKQIILISLGIGFLSTLVIFLMPKFLLHTLFNTTEGISYIKVLSPFTLLYFIEVPLIHALQALDKAKISMIITILGSIVRLGSIFIFSFFNLGMYTIVIAIILNLIFSTYFNYRGVKKVLS